MANSYFISDLHLGHENIIAYSSRPFTDIDHMTNSLISRWNKKVNLGDTVYILGDVSFFNKIETKKILTKMLGTKILIGGNHDSDRSIPNECFQYIASYKEIKIEQQKIILFHYPIIEFNGFYKEKAIHFYGHTHCGVYNIKSAYNVGAEVLGYEPCTIEEVIQKNKEWRNNPKCIVKN